MEDERELRTQTEMLADDRQLRLSCVSLAVEVVNKDFNMNSTDVMPLAQKMYEWVKNG